jgi:hypothetical protein
MTIGKRRPARDFEPFFPCVLLLLLLLPLLFSSSIIIH